MHPLPQEKYWFCHKFFSAVKCLVLHLFFNGMPAGIFVFEYLVGTPVIGNLSSTFPPLSVWFTSVSPGEYFLNGHWFIQWSGDYKVAGTVVQYQREGNKESVVAAGPLKEPLHVMVGLAWFHLFEIKRAKLKFKEKEYVLQACLLVVLF